MKNLVSLSVILTLLGTVPGYTHEKADAFDLAKITDGKTWKVSNATVKSVESGGKLAARVRAWGDSGLTGNAGLALAAGVEFDTGVIELDLKGRSQRPSFLGVVFNVADKRTFEGIYFRPFNFKCVGPFRQRAVQYIAWPEHTWDSLRKDYPACFENTVNPIPDPDGWFHARIEVTDILVRVFVNGAKQPCLTVKRLSQGRVKRPVGLFVDVAEGRFANLEVNPANPS
jgi:hypothetical protein